jgi:2-polyprenyl-3-methyl-5-hydroxy-6-metoxy-1,4-benzoquinol methylase
VAEVKNVQENEEQFHDDWASSVDIEEIAVDELPRISTLPEIRYILNFLEEKGIKGKKFLEIGCGFGEFSVYMAKQGAVVTASDLSSGMLDVAKRLAAKHGVAIETCKCPSDETPFADRSFDIVYCGNLLHHVSVEKTTREIFRVLKPGGVFVSQDPIAYNPVINVYRKMANKVRTEDEHPLGGKDIKLMKKFFPDSSFKTFWLFTLAIFLKFYLVDGIHPNDERYWKKIITDYERLTPLYSKLEKIDKLFLAIFPFLKWFCWNGVFIGTKEQASDA